MYSILSDNREKNMTSRIFHPIGQGAFYSERHEDFNIVYDCGNWKNTKSADKIVKQAFEENENIDILFISHFDYDHVNKINTLRDHTNIKKVIMPLLHKNEKIFLTNFYRPLKFGIDLLINNPQKYFGEETQIIEVKDSKNFEQTTTNSKNIDELNKNQQIESGTVIEREFGHCKWIFIPFNYKYSDRNRQLEELLRKDGFNVDKFKTDEKYTSDITIEQRNKIKKIYEKVDGNINQNSMLLYSGSSDIKVNIKQFILNFNFNCINPYSRNIWCEYKAGCIYTGDTDLKEVKIKKIYKKYWDNVGTIQIPHHGDIKSFSRYSK